MELELIGNVPAEIREVMQGRRIPDPSLRRAADISCCETEPDASMLLLEIECLKVRQQILEDAFQTLLNRFNI